MKSNHFISGNKAHRRQHNSQADSQKPTETQTHNNHKQTYLLIIQKCLTSSLGQLHQDWLNTK